MTQDELARMRKRWCHFTPRLLALLEAWDSRRGVLFVSHDDAGDEAAMALATHLTQTLLPYCGETKSEWFRSVDFLLDPTKHTSLFQGPPERPCIVINDLDRRPEWLWYRTKALIERGVRPFICLATTQAYDKLPGWLSSHFHRVTKTGAVRGRRRRPSGKGTGPAAK